MRIAIHQSHYLPWLGYIDKIDRSDCFVILDDCQFEKNDWQNRNRILSPQGWQWMTVPVRLQFGQKINEITAAEPDRWRKKHWNAIVSTYGRCPHFEAYQSALRGFYGEDWTLLSELNDALLSIVLEDFMIDKRILKSSALGVAGTGTERLVSICRELGATEYLYGGHGRDYMDMEAFRRARISLVEQAFAHPVYPQRGGGRRRESFVPGMACLDLLFNCGRDSLRILRRANGR